MLRRLPSDAALLVLAVAVIALVLSATFVLHDAFVGDGSAAVRVDQVHAGDAP